MLGTGAVVERSGCFSDVQQIFLLYPPLHPSSVSLPETSSTVTFFFAVKLRESTGFLSAGSGSAFSGPLSSPHHSFTCLPASRLFARFFICPALPSSLSLLPVLPKKYLLLPCLGFGKKVKVDFFIHFAVFTRKFIFHFAGKKFYGFVGKRHSRQLLTEK